MPSRSAIARLPLPCKISKTTISPFYPSHNPFFIPLSAISQKESPGDKAFSAMQTLYGCEAAGVKMSPFQKQAARRRTSLREISL
jgi:hypothetical protein